MYKFYTYHKEGSIINVFEFKPSDKLVPVVSVGDPKRRQPLTEIRHKWFEDKGWHRLAGVNLSFFGMNTITPVIIGLDYRDHGFTYALPSQYNSKGYELIYKDGELIIGDISNHYFKQNFQNKASWGVTLSYSLVLDGKIDIRNEEYFPHYKYRHPRTCIGQKANGTIVLVVIDGRSRRSRGATARQSAEIMLELGCIKAINADGGGSSQMLYKDKLVNEYPYPQARPIANALLVYSKEPFEEDNIKDYPILRIWSKGDYVLILQRALIAKGYDLGRYGADGVFGPLTLKRVKEFQKDNGLVVDGIVGPKTWSKLLG